MSLRKWWTSKDSLSKAVGIVAAALCIYDLAFILSLFPLVGIHIMVQPHRGINVGAIIFITYILYTPKKKRTEGKLPWYDILLIILGVIPCVYYFLFFSAVEQHIDITGITNYEIVMFFMLAISLVEAGRRLLGWLMPFIAVFFIFHAFFADIFPGFLNTRAFSLPYLASSFYLDSGGVFGMIVGVASTVVVMFMIFAFLLQFSGGGKFFIDLSLAVLGHFRGGPAKAAIIASSLFGTLSGTVSGNVAATGSVTIPLMKDTGYKGEFAGGVEAVASNGGQIVPPIMGATAFVMAEMTGISYLEICFASLLPAVLYYAGLFAQVDLEALKLQLRGLPREELPNIKDVFKKGWQYLVPLIALILFLAVFRYTPERSAVYAMGILILASMVNKESRMGPTKILSALEGAGKAMCIVTISCAIAGFIIGSLLITGVGINLAIGIVDMSGGNPYFLALITAIICFILGMGMGTITIYLMLAVLVSPTLVEMGAPLIAAHLFVLYWGLVSFLTPPVCVAAFVAAGIAKSHPMRTGWNATRLGIVTYIVPFMFLFCPQLVMIGSAGEISLAVITSLAGVLILSAGVVGRLYIELGALSILERILFIGASLLLIKPALVSDAIGIGIVIPVVVFRVILKKRTEAKAETV